MTGLTPRYRSALLAMSIAGAALVMLSTRRYGAGVSPDSVTYVSVARSLVAGRGFVDNNGTPLTAWPPLYPVLLAGVSLITRIDPLVCASVVNAILFAVVIWLSGLLLSAYVTRSPAIAYLGTAAVLVSPTLNDVSVMAWSEPFFIGCVLVFLISVHSYAEGGGTASLVGITLAAAMACLVRYIGVILIPAGILMILLRKRTMFRMRLLHAACVLVVSVVPFTGWALRACRLSGMLLGRHIALKSSAVGDLANTTAGVILQWFLFPWTGRQSELVNAVATAALASAIVASALALVSRRDAIRNGRRWKAALGETTPVLLFIVLYIAFLIASSVLAGITPIEPRLVAPLYVPVALLFFFFLDKAIGPPRAATLYRNARRAVLASVTLWLFVPAVEVGRASLRRNHEGAGWYSTVGWEESPTIDFIAHLDPSARAVLYSNAPEALYVLRNIKARSVPGRRSLQPEEQLEALHRLEGVWPEEDSGLLVWFSGVEWRYYKLTPSELGLAADIDTLAKLGDGIVYKVSRRPPGKSGNAIYPR
jgi:hypothetical protein